MIQSVRGDIGSDVIIGSVDIIMKQVDENIYHASLHETGKTFTALRTFVTSAILIALDERGLPIHIRR